MSAHSSHVVDPRVLRTRQSVIAATQDALVEEGYAAITIDGIAWRSGVARTTIYRHWGSLADLVIEAVTLIDEQWSAPDTGSVRDDLVAQATGLNEKLSTSEWGEPYRRWSTGRRAIPNCCACTPSARASDAIRPSRWSIEASSEVNSTPASTRPWWSTASPDRSSITT